MLSLNIICSILICIPLIYAGKRENDDFSFSWSNCGAGESVQVKALTISPDPITLPGDVTISADVSTYDEGDSPLTTKLTIKRKVAFIWVDVPCIDGVGSCTYDDFCSVLEQYFPISEPCPSVLKEHGIPCNCPIPKGNYILPTTSVPIASDPVPSWLADGQYKIKIEVISEEAPYICLELSLALSSPSVDILKH